jgi:hypothetical protein
VIRQAISCDLCGNEKKQTNHWFVAYEQGEELRVSGWSSRNRLRPGTKHLCGQTCLHKLVDEFMAKAIGQKAQGAHVDAEPSSARTDASLTSRAAYSARPAVRTRSASSAVPVEGSSHSVDLDVESSARLITQDSMPMPAAKPAAELFAMTAKLHGGVIPLDDEPRFASRILRAEAWERERERELRSQECRTDLARRRVNGR